MCVNIYIYIHIFYIQWLTWMWLATSWAEPNRNSEALKLILRHWSVRVPISPTVHQQQSTSGPKTSHDRLKRKILKNAHIHSSVCRVDSRFCPLILPALPQRRPRRAAWRKRPSATRAAAKVTGAQSMSRPRESPANAGTRSIPTTTRSFLKPTPASESRTLAKESGEGEEKQRSMRSLSHPPACTYSRLWDDFPCCAGTWGKTFVGIQMAKNSPGALQRTRESGPCSAPTSLNVAPRVKPAVRNSIALMVQCVTCLKAVKNFVFRSLWMGFLKCLF